MRVDGRPRAAGLDGLLRADTGGGQHHRADALPGGGTCGVLACTAGYPVTCHPYRPRPAGADRDPRTLGEAFREALSLVVANSKTPMRLVSSLGILAGSLNLCYVLYVVAVYLFKKEVARLGDAILADLHTLLLRLPHPRGPVGVRRARSWRSRRTTPCTTSKPTARAW